MIFFVNSPLHFPKSLDTKRTMEIYSHIFSAVFVFVVVYSFWSADSISTVITMFIFPTTCTLYELWVLLYIFYELKVKIIRFCVIKL